MNKHTPGPWGFDPPDEDTPPVVWACGIRIARLSAMSPEEMLANARLIAAAPDLLEALEDLLADSPGVGITTACLKARAAIDKAEGTA